MALIMWIVIAFASLAMVEGIDDSVDLRGGSKTLIGITSSLSKDRIEESDECMDDKGDSESASIVTDSLKRTPDQDGPKTQVEPGVFAKLSLSLHQCGFVDTCFGRCGSAPSDRDSIFSFIVNDPNPSSMRTTYACFCDELCKSYGDCCIDYYGYCQVSYTEKQTSNKGTPYINDRFGNILESINSTGQNEELTSDPDSQDGQENVSLECMHISEFEQGSLWLQTKCHSDWTDHQVEFLCQSVNYKDDLTFLLVQGQDGKTYRNIFCAMCNFLNAGQFWIMDSFCYGELPNSIYEKPEKLSLYLLTKCITRFRVPFGHAYRPCLKMIETCPISERSSTSKYANIEDQCQNGHQSLVTGDVTSAKLWGSRLYRNIYCAQCSGVEISSINCPTKEQLQEQFLNNKTQTERLLGNLVGRDENTGVTCRIVTNYNVADRYSGTVIYEESGAVVPVVVTCDEGEVFDPYIGKCRPVHCNDGYILVELECVPVKATNDLADEDIIEIQHAVMSAINDTLGLEDEVVVTVRLIIEWDHSHDRRDHVDIPSVGSLPRPTPALNTTEWDIHVSKIVQNSTRTDEHEHSVYEVTMILVIEDPLAINRHDARDFVGLLSVLADLNDADEIHVCLDNACLHPSEEDLLLMKDVTDGNITDLSYLVSRCRNGNITFIDSSDFLILSENNGIDEVGCPTLYVNDAEEVYECTDNYIFGYDPSKPAEYQNFGALVCKSSSPLDPSCELLQLNTTEYRMLPNGSILVHGSYLYDPDEYFLTPRGVEICNIHSNVISETVVVFFDFSDPQKTLMYIGLAMSTTCILLTLFTYIFFVELRTVPGMHRMSLMVASIAGNIVMMLATSLRPTTMACQVVAMILHYLFLTRIFWTNAIMVHSFYTFGSNIHKRINQSLQVLRQRQSRSYIRQYTTYALYAWGMPVIITVLGGTCHFCACGSMPVYYGIYFSCWIADPKSFVYLFAVPLSVLIIANGVLYVLTICSIRQTTRNNPNKERGKAKKRSEVAIYIKISTTSGFSWMFAIMAAFTGFDFMWYLFSILMSLEGVFMFISFFCTKRIMTLYSKRFGPKLRKLSSAKKSTGPVYVVSEDIKQKPSDKSIETRN